MTAVPGFTAGQSVTAQQLAFLLGGAATRKPSFQAHLATAQSIVSGTSVTAKWDTVDEDTDGGYSTSTGIYTVATPGLWLITVQTAYAGANTTGVRGIEGQHNGLQFIEQWMPASADVGSAGRQNAARIVRLGSGDTFNVNVFQSAGATLSLGGSTLPQGFSGAWIGA